MKLKKYQKKTIDKLETLINELQKVGLKYSFMGVTEKPYKADAFGDIPFVCVKIPTGGGKTMVGCYAIEKIMRGFLQY